ncbi:MAG: FliH/SctL family protein [Acidobacteriaceae bacterium]|jgi:flagellar assembly protein FliH
MMSMSSDALANQELLVPVKSFSYRDMGAPASFQVSEAIPAAAEQEPETPVPPGVPEKEVKALVNIARLEAVAETEARLQMEYEARSAEQFDKMRQALELFQAERRDYFSRVESDVVQLALAIAAKILHREAQVDPMLVAALVRVAIDKLHDGSSVSVRVSPAEAGKWRAFLANPLNGSTIEIVEDAHLGVADCILETELGSANFSIEAQMKEVEQGFFDLLAQRPVIK